MRNPHTSAVPDKPFLQAATSFFCSQPNQEAEGKRTLSSQVRNILHIANPLLLLHVANLKDLLLCSCFHSLLRAREARADSCSLSAEKGICCSLVSWGTTSRPLRKADIISSVWHLHSALEHSYVNVRQSGILFKSCKPIWSQEGNASLHHPSI